jgi:hypothetical protein
VQPCELVHLRLGDDYRVPALCGLALPVDWMPVQNRGVSGREWYLRRSDMFTLCPVCSGLSILEELREVVL